MKPVSSGTLKIGKVSQLSMNASRKLRTCFLSVSVSNGFIMLDDTKIVKLFAFLREHFPHLFDDNERIKFDD